MVNKKSILLGSGVLVTAVCAFLACFCLINFGIFNNDDVNTNNGTHNLASEQAFNYNNHHENIESFENDNPSEKIDPPIYKGNDFEKSNESSIDFYDRYLNFDNLPFNNNEYSKILKDYFNKYKNFNNQNNNNNTSNQVNSEKNDTDNQDSSNVHKDIKNINEDGIIRLNGICYKLDSDKKEAMVVKSTALPYKGNIEIPIYIQYNGVSYLVTSMEESAFADCVELYSINIPGSIKSISNYAFNNCYGLNEVKLNKGLEIIGESAFYNCLFCNIKIPSTVTDIHVSAFNAGIGAVVFDSDIPANLDGFNVFHNLTKIFVPDNSINSYKDKWIFYADQILSIEKDSTKEYENVGENITAKLNFITGTLEISGKGSMYDFSDDPGMTAPWINDINCFSNVEIQDGILNIGNFAFVYCALLTNIKIPDSVLSIGAGSFFLCLKLGYVEIPSFVEKIGYVDESSLDNYFPAFFGEYCYISVSNKNVNFCSYNGSLFSRDKLILYKWYFKDVQSSDVLIPSGTSEIKNFAFDFPMEISTISKSFHIKITLPETIKKIGIGNLEVAWSIISYAQEPPVLMQDIRSVELTGIYVYANSVSKYQAADYWIDVEDKITSLDDAYVNFDNIGLNEDSKLKGILDKIHGKLTFTCEKPDYMKDYSSEDDNRPPWYDLRKCILSVDDSNCLQSIGSNAFMECSYLNNVKLGNGFERIESYAFMDCEMLSVVNISKSLKYIGGSAFLNCSLLDSLDFPAEFSDDSEISTAAFYESSLKKVTFYSSKPCKINEYVFPDSISIYVPKISLNVYKSAWPVYENNIFVLNFFITFSNVGGKVYADYFPYTHQLNIYGNGYMYDFDEDNVPWKDYASDIQVINVEDGVTSVGNFAFNNCYKLKEINFGTNVFKIGMYVFNGCHSLTDIKINSDNKFLNFNDGVLYNIINEKGNAGWNCAYCIKKKTGSINLIDDTVSIADGAFLDSKLSSLFLPQTIVSIGQHAFLGCSDNINLYFYGDKPNIESESFWGLTFNLYYVSNLIGSKWNPAEINLGGATNINYKPMLAPTTVQNFRDMLSEQQDVNIALSSKSELKFEDKNELIPVNNNKQIICYGDSSISINNNSFHVKSGSSLNIIGCTIKNHKMQQSSIETPIKNSTENHFSNQDIRENNFPNLDIRDNKLEGLSCDLSFFIDESNVLNLGNNEEKYNDNTVIYNYGTTNLIDCNFIDNQVLYSLVYNYGTLNISSTNGKSCLFSNNKSMYSADKNDWGGACIYNANSAEINSCVFDDCWGLYGGAINNSGLLKLNNCSFNACSAKQGAAIFNTAAYKASSKEVHTGNLTLTDCTISRCNATEKGGAIVVKNSSSLSFDGICNVVDNTIGSDSNKIVNNIFLDYMYTEKGQAKQISTFSVNNAFDCRSKIGITVVDTSKLPLVLCKQINQSQYLDTTFVSDEENFKIYFDSDKNILQLQNK